MKVAILGCGAMGTVLGAYLTVNGFPVDMIDAYEAHVDALNEKGARIIGHADMTVPVHAITPAQMQDPYDIVFLFTKQLANDTVLPALLPYLHAESTVCTLQNGVPEPFVAHYVGEKRTVGGTVLWGATFHEPGISELTQDIGQSDHLFEIGEIDGSVGDRIRQVAGVLEHMGPVRITDSLMASRWGKLVNNACMSGMSAVCGCTFGEVLADPVARACLSYLGREVKRCCEAEGYRLPPLLGMPSPPDYLALEDQAMFDTSQREFLRMYDGLRDAKASMLQDLEKGQRTEVHMINGYVSQTGRKHGIPTPFNDWVVEIVSGIEEGKLPLGKGNLQSLDRTLLDYALYDEAGTA